MADTVVESAPVNDENKEAIPKELTAKHPLEYEWVLWYCRIDKNASQITTVEAWQHCLKEVVTCATVEDFWAFYTNVQLASGLQHGSDYYFFKKGIRPMWEDESNAKGGRWLITVDKPRRPDVLDRYWLELLLAMIGEQFEGHGDQICGAVVNIRNKGDKISLWTRDSSNEEVNKEIGVIVKKKLDIMDKLTYESHHAVSHKKSSMVKPVIWV